MKFTVASLLALLLLSLVSCIDIFQHVSMDKDGRISTYLKVSVSKTMIALAEMDSDEPTDCESVFGYIDSDYLEGIPEGLEATLQTIDTESECGLSLALSIDLKSPAYESLYTTNEVPFIPVLYKDRLVIDLGMGNDTNSPGDQMAIAVLSAFKYRLTISKSISYKLDRAVLSTKTIDYKPEIIDLPDMFMIEIPISYIVSADQGAQLIATFSH